MKNLQKGFVIPLLLGIIAVLIIGGGVYIYNNKKVEIPAAVDNGIQQASQTQQQTNIQTPPVATNPPLKVLSPNGGEVWKTGQTYTIAWQTNNIALLSSYSGVTIDLTNESDHRVLQIVPESSQLSFSTTSYRWVIPSSIPAGNYKVMVTLNSKMDSSVYNAPKVISPRLAAGSL